jgi:hypothetical protein
MPADQPNQPPPPARMNCFTCQSFSLDPWGCVNRNAYPAVLSDGTLACTRYEHKPTEQPKAMP